MSRPARFRSCGRGQVADRGVLRAGAPGAALEHPASTRRLSPKPGHRNLPAASWRNQLTWKMRGGCLQPRAHAAASAPVVAEVVAAERLHRHRVAAHDADRAGGGGGGLGGHRGADQHAVLPVARLVDQRRQLAPPAAEDQRRDRHAARVLGRPASSSGSALARDREARVRMRRRAVLRHRRAGPASRWPASPCLAAFPPGLVVGRQRDVGEQRVAADHLVGVAVGLRVGARHDAEVAGLRD